MPISDSELKESNPEITSFSPTCGEILVDAGDPLTLTLSVSGFPHPRVQFFRKGGKERISQNENVKIG